MTGVRFFGLALGLLALSASCASSTDRGRVLYGEQRFIEAAEVFEHSEAQLGHYEERDRAHYGLYRGMTLLRLGDLDAAERWLYFAQSVEAAHPGTLQHLELRALRQANQLLDVTRSRTLGAPDPLGGAVARSKNTVAN